MGIIFICGMLASCTSPGPIKPEALTISRLGFDPLSEKFVAHKDYVALNLPFAAFQSIYQKLNGRADVGPLVSRGEAHVTVLTPPEFAALQGRVSMIEINHMFDEKQIELWRKSPTPLMVGVCVGAGSALVDGKPEQTYFVVMRAEALVELRRQIARLAASRGGPGGAGGPIAGFAGFVPEHFYPHVTVGFSKIDLHEQNGVIKDEKSCRWPLEITD